MPTAEVDQRADVEDLDLQDVPGLGALDVHGAGERMDPAEVERHRPVRGEGVRLVPDVQGIPAQQLDLFARAHGHGRLQVPVPAVVQDLAVAVQDPFPARRGDGFRRTRAGHVDGAEPAGAGKLRKVRAASGPTPA